MDSIGDQPTDLGRYSIQMDPSGRAKCQMCLQKIDKGTFRMGRRNFLFLGNQRKSNIGFRYFHIDCLFKKLSKCRVTTQVLESTDDISGYVNLPADVQEKIDLCLLTLKDHRKKLQALFKAKPIRRTKMGSNTESRSSLTNKLTKKSSTSKIRVLYTNADIMTPGKKAELLNLIQV